MKTGLVMEGGAMRGMFTAGVLDVLMEVGITFPGAIGVSAGAVFGCNFKSKQIGRTIRYNKKYCRDKRFASFHSWLTTGNLYGVEFSYHLIPEQLDPFDLRAYRENPMEFYVVCTDAKTGEAVYRKCEEGDGEDLEWMRASASLPFVSEIVKIGDGYFSDGGMADSVPVRFFESIGYEKNVVILTQPRGYRKRKRHTHFLFKPLLRRYPKLYESIQTRPERYNETLDYIDEREKTGALLVICPKESLKIGKVEHNPERLEAVYQLGRQAAEENIGKIRAFLSGNNQ